ncbi:hypothetical protein C4565_10525 [Candidatus Parcubacteria bacterium]|nr:MAG: hypothetical protein C4565_10525 [Candidatus Parcubacteria bacterium]
MANPLTLIFFAIIVLLLIAKAAIKKKLQYWLPREILRLIRHLFAKWPTSDNHIILAFVDHFEPGNRHANLEQQIERVDAWTSCYPKLAGKHRDSDDIPPQHTFFFPPHYDNHDHLKKIVGLCSQGYGEVEMHLHHDRQGPWPETEDTLRQKIIDCIAAFSRYGIFCLPNGEKKFAFIHGDWALANSLKNNAHCGVNDELTILQEAGCYADFTFPVCNEAQPKHANVFFQALSSPHFPKGYNHTALIPKVGKKSPHGLLFIQGIIGLRWKSRKHRFKPSIEQSNIDMSDLPTPGRIDYWVNKRIHIPGRPNWIFIKIHTHGAREEDRDVLLGHWADKMYTYLETAYNDRKRYFFHYVSAREMYNIACAAIDGKSENPHAYRDYIIPRYVYLPKERKLGGD